MISVGNKSTVNCILENLQPQASDKHLISKVFATPGSPSIKTWPLDNKALSIPSITPSCPTIILPIQSIDVSPNDNMSRVIFYNKTSYLFFPPGIFVDTGTIEWNTLKFLIPQGSIMDKNTVNIIKLFVLPME